MKAKFLTSLVTEELIGSKYARLVKPFLYQSPLLDWVVIIPAGFVCDYESVPLFKATSKRAGVIHDYLCRKDSVPIVSKQMAASVYAEAQQVRDHLVCKNKWQLVWRAILCSIKTTVVRVAPGYYHKHKVCATVDELSK